MGNIIFTAGQKIIENAPAITWVAEEGDALLQAAGRVNNKGADGVDLLIGETPLRPPEELAAKCLVNFRPHSKWGGEFGFDWVRMGDSGLKGDTWYRDLIGYYEYSKKPDGTYNFCNPKFIHSVKEYDDLLFREFKTFSIPWKLYGNKKPYLYCVPYLSLLPEKKAVLSLKLEIEEAPDSFKWEYNEARFNIACKKELPLTSGKTELTDALEITCLDYFETDEFIELYAIKDGEQTLAGRVVAVRNHPKYHRKIKVLFVAVTSGGRTGSTTGEEALLKKYMRQAFVKPEVQYTKLDYADNARMQQLLTDRSWVLQEELEKALAGKKNSKGQLVGDIFSGYFRIYFLPQVSYSKNSCGDGGYLLGQSDKIPEKKSARKCGVMILDRKRTCEITKTPVSSCENTVTHEILHAIGLQHSFVNGSKYVFEQYTTDNIMDYYDHNTRIKGIQLFKWQWDIIRKML